MNDHYAKKYYNNYSLLLYELHNYTYTRKYKQTHPLSGY